MATLERPIPSEKKYTGVKPHITNAERPRSSNKFEQDIRTQDLRAKEDAPQESESFTAARRAVDDFLRNQPKTFWEGFLQGIRKA